MKRTIPFIVLPLITALLFIANCADFQSPTAGEGSISLNVILSSDIEGVNGGKSIQPSAVSTTDRVHCTISHSASVVYDEDLTFASNQFSGVITVDVGSNYLVEIDYYKDNILGYTGSQSGITVTSGQTTPCTIILSPTQPQAPTALTLTVSSPTHIYLTWIDNSINETGFKIERKTGSAGSYSQIAVAGVNIETYSDASVDSNTEYYYRVLAYNTSGNSAYSNEANASTTVYSAGYTQTFPLGTSGLSIEMVWIPPGSFMQGCGESGSYPWEYPQHLVTLNYGFWMGKYEVTQAQWEAIAGAWSFGFDNHPDYPAEMVSWDDVNNSFLPELNNQTSGNPWRLPTESEWEYACRAGTTTLYYWGNDIGYSMIGNYAWYLNNSGNTTHTVGSLQPNAWNLYDMSGNVGEWVEDWYHSDYAGAPNDGSAWLTPAGNLRVVRAGSWPVSAYCCASARRSTNSVGSSNDIGFRIVRNP